MQNTWSAIAPSGLHARVWHSAIRLSRPRAKSMLVKRASEIRGEQVMRSGAA
jgi:hypothetical protein